MTVLKTLTPRLNSEREDKRGGWYRSGRGECRSVSGVVGLLHSLRDAATGAHGEALCDSPLADARVGREDHLHRSGLAVSLTVSLDHGVRDATTLTRLQQPLGLGPRADDGGGLTGEQALVLL